MEVISIRPTKEMTKKLENLAKIRHMERSSLVRELLDIGIQEKLKEHALDLFTKNKISVGKAAEIAEISVREMLELIKERNILLHISSEDLKKDFEAATT
ncbi:MAG: UPF0175 family protein [Methanocellales archaeon]|nr:UPF0175 family protein [Methanocellales archaeon]MDI6859742.1 UPF0175 family protein [Methanocellales archaeon]MDI6903241.1 UPF0175 family protein [Methanocellales archaeon]